MSYDIYQLAGFNYPETLVVESVQIEQTPGTFDAQGEARVFHGGHLVIRGAARGSFRLETGVQYEARKVGGSGSILFELSQFGQPDAWDGDALVVRVTT